MKFDTEKWKVYTWKNWMMLHWIINPGLAFNEIILGQRVPKISLEDKLSSKPRLERSFTPCPHCDTIHDSRTWGSQKGTGFKNWFGLYCPNCGEIIPCLMNGFSFIILALTFPIWGWFKNTLKDNWLKNQPARFENLDLENIPNPYDGTGWIKQGLGFGLIMFVLMEILTPLLRNEEFATDKFITVIPIWIIGGLVFGFTMKLVMNKK